MCIITHLSRRLLLLIDHQLHVIVYSSYQYTFQSTLYMYVYTTHKHILLPKGKRICSIILYIFHCPRHSLFFLLLFVLCERRMSGSRLVDGLCGNDRRFALCPLFYSALQWL